LRAARPAVPAILRITRSVRPLLSPLREALDDLTPVVRAVGRHKCDVTNFAAVLRSMTGFGVPGTNGTGPDGQQQTGPPQQFRLGLVISPYEALGQRSPDGYGERDPYPVPCKYTQANAVVDDPVSLRTRGSRGGR
jgi:hypothetical protein